MLYRLVLLIALLAPAGAGATTINFDTVPTDTTYIDSGLLLGSTPSGYGVGGCGVGQVGCLGDGAGFSGELTFTFVELGTTVQAVTNMVEFLMCRECAFRGSSAQVFDAFGALLTTIDMNTADGVLNRTYSFSAANIGSVVIDLGIETDAVESITFGTISVVPEPGTFTLVGLGILGMAITSRSTR